MMDPAIRIALDTLAAQIASIPHPDARRIAQTLHSVTDAMREPALPPPGDGQRVQPSSLRRLACDLNVLAALRVHYEPEELRWISCKLFDAAEEIDSLREKARRVVA